MAKIHGFKLKRCLVWFSRCVFKNKQIRPDYHHFGSLSHSPTMKILRWGRKLTEGAMSLFNRPSYVRLGSDPKFSVPKGHMVVYVGRKEEEIIRVMVPVIYFNHPLFVELLREVEEEYGFNHQGGITIPCRFTEFERVKTWIASGS
ncbi:auxin-induced protein, partial [Trifolium medium]|nr:auxin-induced protein [Trifolium medium]